MRIFALTSFVICILCFGQAARAQQTPGQNRVVNADNREIRSSQAYAELLLKRTELEAEVEAMLLEYTEEYPTVVEARQHLRYVRDELALLMKLKPADAGKLTLALGKMMTRRAELSVVHWKLLENYKEEHPDVKRAKRRIEIYDRAINEILG